MPLLFLLLFVCNLNLSAFAQHNNPSAEEILKKAYTQAKAENKNIFLMFHASWCHWCHKMDNAMNNPVCKGFFDKNYIIVHMTKGEYQEDKKLLNTPGVEDFVKKHRGKKTGLPYWLILDKDGNCLSTAHAKENEASNLGCPASKEEVELFITKLKKSSTLEEEELQTIFDVFRKNDPSYEH